MMDPQSYDPSDILCPIRFPAGATKLRMLDQRILPEREYWLEIDELETLARAIEDLVVRGAPAIACAATLGLAVVARTMSSEPEEFRRQFQTAIERLRNTRPTAVNLFVALKEQEDAIQSCPSTASVEEMRQLVLNTALKHVHSDLESCRSIGRFGGPLLPEGKGVLTHCNAGALATAGYGTALGVIRNAHESGRGISVYADETRPVLQGARLTAWELLHDNIPVTVIADNMAAALMASGKIGAVVVGADRIARNGDVANKIGTYNLAVLCKHHQIPFYVAAPWTTIDLNIESGSTIPIEERREDEVRYHGGEMKTPSGASVWNPAFDVTPANLITSIISDRGVFAPQELSNSQTRA